MFKISEIQIIQKTSKKESIENNFVISITQTYILVAFSSQDNKGKRKLS